MTTASIWPWLVLSLGLTVLDSISTVTSSYLRHRLNDELNVTTSVDLLRHASTLDLSQFENPIFQDMISRAQRPLSSHIVLFITDFLTVISGVIQLVTLAILLVAIEPLFTAVVPIILLPYFQGRG